MSAGIREVRSGASVLLVALLLALAACGGGGGGGGSPPPPPPVTSTGTSTAALVAPPTGGGNTLAITFDRGPAGIPFRVLNAPYVSVTVCTPGTATCQTIDRVLLDTGSTGLRLLRSALSSSLDLPQIATGAQALGECAQFADGFVWGSVRLADIYLGGQIAPSVAVQDIGDNPGGVTTIPGDCVSAGGRNLGASVTVFGANGILGVSQFINDCDPCLTSVIPATYYACATSCTGTLVTTGAVVRNPVARLTANNNGILIDIPAVPVGGLAAHAGTLTFGIGTQSNNALGSAVVYAVNSMGNFTTSYTPVGASTPVAITAFVDSGSNGLFFTDPGITGCSVSVGFYCPSSPLSLTARNASVAPGGPVATVNFTVDAVDSLAGSIVVAHAAGTAGSFVGGMFDWGAPFFFGRRVFVAITGATTPAGPGPYLAY